MTDTTGLAEQQKERLARHGALFDAYVAAFKKHIELQTQIGAMKDKTPTNDLTETLMRVLCINASFDDLSEDALQLAEQCRLITEFLNEIGVGAIDFPKDQAALAQVAAGQMV